MCGVVGIVYSKLNKDLGETAAKLLKRLEYRGYDSTGAAFFRPDGTVALKKKVGSPTEVIRKLEIDRETGHKFLGQVRWATYGAVTDLNAQPHELTCRCHIVGAHNGNLSNTDEIKEFLVEDGHKVVSDNDGEMLVHEVEHYYHRWATALQPKTDSERVDVTIKAIRSAQQRVEGSYSACVAFPDLPGIFAMKSGSSLYAGKGSDANGPFIVVSSDLTSVLSKTRFLIPLAEGQGIYFTHDEFRLFSLTSEEEFPPRLTRSRLNLADIALQSRYKYFMHQEIYTASENVDRILRYYFLDPRETKLFELLEKMEAQCREIVFDLLQLYDVFDPGELSEGLDALLSRDDLQKILEAAKKMKVDWPDPAEAAPFVSDEAQLLTELAGLGSSYVRPLWVLDQIIIWKKKRKVIRYRDELCDLLKQCAQKAGRVFAIGAGTSHHASLVGAFLFNSVAGLSIVPVNPGMFRSMYLNALSDDDMIIGVTQSGETKDLLDIYNDVERMHEGRIKLVTLVNNELSTIPQEKSHFFLPILCGPEVAVAATKSFISQVALFHLLACMAVMEPADAKDTISRVKSVLEFTLSDVEEATSEVALRLFLKPSIHILGTSLIGLAREGALKIREVVLNHTEGYDGAEFKHGPNTILGKNTIFSVHDLERLLADAFGFFAELCARKFDPSAGHSEQLESLLEVCKGIRFQELALDKVGIDTQSRKALNEAVELYQERIRLDNYFTNYPLIFICPPYDRDINITTTQIHTHKIRGADIILISQDNKQLRRSVEGIPAGFDEYYSRHITVPTMFDKEMFVYQAAVTLQLLAFKMSLAKMKFLNRNKVDKHGVHPDVPKNVSKSITVD